MSYRSIFLEPDWLHVRYLGWTDAWPQADLRVMSKRNGPIVRHLVVCDLDDDRHVLALTEIARLQSPLSEVTVHDLRKSRRLADKLSARCFRELSADRMLNNHTAVIDLSADEDLLLAQMSADTRRILRKAEGEGITTRADAQDDPALLERFLAAYAAMAEERALARIDRAALEAQFRQGAARLAAAFSASGASASFALTYEAGAHAMYHHGVSDGPRDTTIGRVVQWVLIRELKWAGLRWYDLGGLPTPDPANGITRFKLGFGGKMVDLGKEYRGSGAIVAAARRVARLLQR